jgi:predicted dehydrogenase
MTDVLVLGWSDIVRRRVLPALAGLERIGAIHVATSMPDPGAPLDPRVASSVHGTDAIERALERIDAELVYVSGTNVAHGPRVIAALASGRHVVVDKPGLPDADERAHALRLAAEGRLVLEESTVWAWHPQVTGLTQRLVEHGARIDVVLAAFSVPMFAAGDFRLDRAAGGGALADLGAYATSVGRVFAGAPIVLEARVTRTADTDGARAVRHDDTGAGVDLAFTLRSRHEGGTEVVGAFGFGTGYLNRVTLLGPGLRAELRPAFSSRPDQRLAVELELDGEDRSFEVAPADPFALLLDDVLDRLDGSAEERGPSAAFLASSADLAALVAATGRGA